MILDKIKKNFKLIYVLYIILFGLLAIYTWPEMVFIYEVLSWDIRFADPGNPFMESLIDLYFTIWYLLIVILILVVFILIRILFFFSWDSFFGKTLCFFNLFFFNLLLIYLSFVHITEIKSYLNRILKITGNLNIVNMYYVQKKNKALAIQKVSEYRKLETGWSIAPAMSLSSIGNPTFALIYALDPSIDPDVVVKVIGHQWYWTYEYDVSFDVTPESVDYIFCDRERFIRNWQRENGVFSGKGDESIETWINAFKRTEPLDISSFLHEMVKHKEVVHYTLSFDCEMQQTEDIAEGVKRILETSRPIVLPTSTPIKILVTSGDVLHSWTAPSLGLKIDAVPGRINQFAFEIKRPGYFFGQCSELCGYLHAYMPINIQVVEEEEFKNWIRSNGKIS